MYHSFGAGSPRSRRHRIRYLARAYFWFIDGCLLTVPSTRQEGWNLAGIYFIRALIPFTKDSPSWPSHLPRAPHPHPITLGIGATQTFSLQQTSTLCHALGYSGEGENFHLQGAQGWVTKKTDNYRMIAEVLWVAGEGYKHRRLTSKLVWEGQMKPMMEVTCKLRFRKGVGSSQRSGKERLWQEARDSQGNSIYKDVEARGKHDVLETVISLAEAWTAGECWPHRGCRAGGDSDRSC